MRGTSGGTGVGSSIVSTPDESPFVGVLKVQAV
jgi:hypothetical protein